MQSVKYIIDLETYNREQINSKTIVLKNGTTYTILNYKSDETIHEDSGKYRSIILNESGKLVCFAPPKSIPFDNFKNNYPIEDETILYNEVVEGTMINLFYDQEKSLWEIATKSSIGGNYWYFRNQYSVLDKSEKLLETPELTFRQMFLNGLGMSELDDLQNSRILESLDKKYCYSFILQHPMNHIVHRIIAPTLYLVAVYEINGNYVTIIDQDEYEYWPNIFKTSIRFPKRFFKETYDVIYSNKCSPESTYDIPGLMFLNRYTGERACMENEAYKKVRELRGNNPNLQYQFLTLRKTDKINEFLIHFDQYTELFDAFQKQYDFFIKNLHNGYVEYYVKKTGNTVSKQYFPLVYKIHHEIFIPSMENGSKIIIKRDIVADFIDKMDPKSLIYYLNWKESKKYTPLKIYNGTPSDSPLEIDVPLEIQCEKIQINELNVTTQE